MFDTFAGTGAGVLRIGAGTEHLGLDDHRISAIHAFRTGAGDLVILAGTYGEGMFRSTDEGTTWTPANEGLTAPAARTIVPDPHVQGALLCGTEPARLFRSLDAGTTWSELHGILALGSHDEWYLPYSPRAGALRNVYAPPDDTGRLLAAVEVGGLLQSPDRGETWSIDSVGPNDDIHQITGHPEKPDLLWCSLGYAALRSRERGDDAPALGGVARSHDGGRSWDILHTRYTRSTIVPPERLDLVLSGPAPDVGQQGGIEVSADGGTSWEPAGDGIETPMPDMVELFVPAPDGTVYAVCARGRLLRSEPGPWRWRSALPGGPPENVVSVSFLET
jgi:photosystem II stability/assembly factor-like uncharacterized protein